jgi:uncharacterized protein YbbK (DUF523 family)
VRKILVSACLLGHKVRYDGGGVLWPDPRLQKWLEEERLVPVCPEVEGGLPTPRPPAQIRDGRVVTGDGTDVTVPFDRGAQAALDLARKHGAVLAILKQSSPSCGSLQIYDGTFSGRKIPGEGRTTALLRRHGIQVFGEDQLDEVEQALLLQEQQVEE